MVETHMKTVTTLKQILSSKNGRKKKGKFSQEKIGNLLKCKTALFSKLMHKLNTRFNKNLNTNQFIMSLLQETKYILLLF